MSAAEEEEAGNPGNELVRKHVLRYLTQQLRVFLSMLGARARPALLAVHDAKKVAKMTDGVMHGLGYGIAKPAEAHHNSETRRAAAEMTNEVMITEPPPAPASSPAKPAKRGSKLDPQ